MEKGPTSFQGVEASVIERLEETGPARGVDTNVVDRAGEYDARFAVNKERSPVVRHGGGHGCSGVVRRGRDEAREKARAEGVGMEFGGVGQRGDGTMEEEFCA